MHILNSKVIQQYQIELFGTEVDLSDTNQQRGRPVATQLNTTRIKITFIWIALRRAHVTAGLTGRDPNEKVNVLWRFH